jgi:hypothetical protein
MEVFKNFIVHKNEATAYYTGNMPPNTLYMPTEAEAQALYVPGEGYQLYDWLWVGFKWIRNKWNLLDKDVYVAFPYGSHVLNLDQEQFLQPVDKITTKYAPPVVFPSGEEAQSQLAHDLSLYGDNINFIYDSGLNQLKPIVPVEQMQPEAQKIVEDYPELIAQAPPVDIIELGPEEQRFVVDPLSPVETIEPERIDFTERIIEDYPQPDENYPVYFEQPKEVIMELPVNDNVYNPVAPNEDNINVDYNYPEDVPINDPVAGTQGPPPVQIAGLQLDKKTLLIGALLLILFVSRK